MSRCRESVTRRLLALIRLVETFRCGFAERRLASLGRPRMRNPLYVPRNPNTRVLDRQ